MMTAPRTRSAAARTALHALFVAAWFAVAAAPAAAADGPQPIPAGEIAPQFESVDLNEKPFSLKEALAEGPVALVFWSLLCGSCREELPLLQQELPRFEANKVRLYAVNLDQATHRTPVKKFTAQQGFTFPILLNESGGKVFAIETTFKVQMTPAFFLIGTDGKILYSHYGPLETSQLDPEVFSKLPKQD
jgi:peroxiredoxin